MIIYRKIPRGKAGTKKWVEKYGDDLVCVRYRYDTDQKWMTKTIELKVDDRPWEQKRGRIPANKSVAIRVDFREMDLRLAVKSAGGKWDPERKCWMLAYREVLALGLKKRMISN
jgi:hypothetical protein